MTEASRAGPTTVQRRFSVLARPPPSFVRVFHGCAPATAAGNPTKSAPASTTRQVESRTLQCFLATPTPPPPLAPPEHPVLPLAHERARRRAALSAAHFGGVEIYTQDVVRAFQARGHRVSAPRSSTSPAARWLHAPSPTRRRLRDAPADPDDAAGAAVPSALRPPGGRGLVRAALRASAPDVVHVQSGYLLGAPAIAAARRTGIPVVVTLHDYWFACPRVTLPPVRRDLAAGPSGPQVRLVPDRRPAPVPAGSTALSGRRDARAQRSLAAWWRCRSAGRRRARWPTASIGCCRPAGVGRGGPRADPVRRRAGRRGIGSRSSRCALSRCGMPPIARVRRSAPARRLRLSLHRPAGAAQGRPARRGGRARPPRPADPPRHPRPAHAAAGVCRARCAALAGDDARITFHGPYRREALPRALRGHRRRGGAVGLARGGGDGHPGSAGGRRAGRRLGAGRIAGAHPRRRRRAAVRSGRSRRICSASWPGCSTNRACWSGSRRRAPRRGRIDDEVDGAARALRRRWRAGMKLLAVVDLVPVSRR